MLGELSNSGSMPVLEAVLRFAGQRQRIIAHNIANITTAGFQPTDVSVRDFQANLKGAIDARRSRGGTGGIELERTEEIQPTSSGGFELVPTTPMDGIMMHDRNNRDPERLMQSLAENTSVFRVAADLLRSQNETLRAAIAQRA